MDIGFMRQSSLNHIDIGAVHLNGAKAFKCWLNIKSRTSSFRNIVWTKISGWKKKNEQKEKKKETENSRSNYNM